MIVPIIVPVFEYACKAGQRRERSDPQDFFSVTACKVSDKEGTDIDITKTCWSKLESCSQIPSSDILAA